MPNADVIAAVIRTNDDTKPQTRSKAGNQERFAVLKNVLSIAAMAAGSILGMSVLVIWPISFFEGWRSDPLITEMLVLSFVLITAGVHYRDILESRSD